MLLFQDLSELRNKFILKHEQINPSYCFTY